MPFYLARYGKKIKKSYTIEVVTPLFISGADVTKTELRTASIKGLLRFWWRALHPTNDLNKLMQDEANIFGSALDDRGNKSSFTLFIEPKNINESNDMPIGAMVNVKNFKIDIFTYLGIGIYEPKRKWVRKHITPGSTFILHCIYNSEYVKDEIEKALSALIYYGGIGAKSRNGFGSLYSKDVACIDFKKNFEKKPPVPYSAFSSKSEVYEFQQQKTWVDALSEIGIAYRQMRLSKELGDDKSFKKRRYIGLPIVQSHDEIIKKSRHAKPCFLHVNKLEGNKFKGQILLLPYEYQGPIKPLAEYNNVIKKMNDIFKSIESGKKVNTLY